MSWEGPIGNLKGPPGAGTIIRDATPLVIGQSYITIVFDTPLPNAGWRFEEFHIVNTTDAEPLNIATGVVTAKSVTGFTVQLIGLPDSGNYFLQWAINAQSLVLVPATTYIFEGPTGGLNGEESTPFTVRLPHGTTIAGPVTITPSRIGGAGTGTFTPASVELSAVTPSATFTFTPSSTGTKTIVVNNDGGLTDPTPLSYVATSLVNLLNALISYWKLDEATGATRNDSKGTNHLGDIGGLSQNPGGKINASTYHDGTARYLSIANNSTLQVTGDFTFSVWVYLTAASANALIIFKGDTGAGLYDYLIGHFGASGFGFGSIAGSSGPLVGSPATTGVWYHLVCWYDSSDSKGYMRINDTTTYVSIGTIGLGQTATPFVVGAYNPPSALFNGAIDEIGFWKRKLTAVEITALYNGGAGLPFSSFTT
jgi:Concanavalin A-like lectin/glucanases superfamily